MTSQLAFNGLRVFFLGHAECGKTTLQKALRVGTEPKSAAYERTLFCETHYMTLKDDAKQKIVSIWDVGGAPSTALD